MGFHTCAFCTGAHQHTSSGDVVLSFTSGQTYVMPDMIVHYVEDHAFLPNSQFVEAVTRGTRAPEKRTHFQHASGGVPHVRVGYLTEPDFPKGKTTVLFQLRLRQLLEQAARQGARIQTRSA